MARQVLPYKPTWLDKFFRKDLERLPQKDRGVCLQSLEDLLADLKACRHPLQDPLLSRWRPTPYKGVVKLAGHLAEYRLGSTMRVIACYFDDNETILLVAVTLKHDHERLKRLLKEHGRSLPDY